LVLLDAEDPSAWKLDEDLRWTNIDCHVLLQVEAGFRSKHAAELYSLGAAYPGMQEFVFHVDFPRHYCQLAHWRALLYVNPVVDGDARLQVRNVDESCAQIFAQTLKLSAALLLGSHRPGFYAQEDEHSSCDDDERD